MPAKDSVAKMHTLQIATLGQFCLDLFGSPVLLLEKTPRRASQPLPPLLSCALTPHSRV